jgi:hypothetical protein
LGYKLTDLGINIEFQEIHAIVTAVHIWQQEFSQKNICFFCDNLGVVSCLNSMKSHNSRVMDLIRHLVLLQMYGNFRVRVIHLPGFYNDISDSLSHFQMDRFHMLAPAAQPQAEVVPPIVWTI